MKWIQFFNWIFIEINSDFIKIAILNNRVGISFDLQLWSHNVSSDLGFFFIITSRNLLMYIILTSKVCIVLVIKLQMAFCFDTFDFYACSTYLHAWWHFSSVTWKLLWELDWAKSLNWLNRNIIGSFET